MALLAWQRCQNIVLVMTIYKTSSSNNSFTSPSSVWHFCCIPRFELLLCAMRCASYHSGFYYQVNISSIYASFYPSLCCGGRCERLNCNFTASSWVSASEIGNRAALVSSSVLPDPDRAEPQQQHATCGEERTEQRKDTDMRRIAARRFHWGRKKEQNVIEIWILGWKTRSDTEKSEIYFFEYIKASDR